MNVHGRLALLRSLSQEEIKAEAGEVVVLESWHDLGEAESGQRYPVENLYLSKCFNCRGVAVWNLGTIIHPSQSANFEPNDDLPADIKQDFIEASQIVQVSPRGAAALLRLCIQKLLKYLGEDGKNINSDIASLVAKGLDPRIQRALDLVRLIGNDAVHPGKLDLRDDRQTAETLFSLVNSIAFDLITREKELSALYGEKLTDEQRESINRRDKPKTSGGQ